MFGKRTLRIAAVAAAVALPMTVAATSSASAAPASKQATVTVFHAIPGAVLEGLGVPGGVVNVCANGSVQLVTDFAPGQLKTLKVDPGSYSLGVFAGPSGCQGPALLSAGATVAAGKSYTVTANLYPTGSPAAPAAPALNVFANNQAPLGKTKKIALKNGLGRVTIRHIAVAPAVDVFLDGKVAVQSLTNPNQAQATLKKGTYQAAAGLAGAGTAGIALGPVPLKVRQGWNTIVYAWGLPAGSLGSTGFGVTVQYVKLNLPKK
ncbi:MAG: hypothetical protein GC156_10095 [Actinomycetales bacterium]|nr:hypothetical protein [Actinomycetales bacterium]